jgi:uncharacterized paraquat-inducible protein A
MTDRPLEDWEEPEPDDEDDASDDEYVCPNCKANVYEDCERCPACGDYITPQRAGVSALSGTWVWLTALGLLILLVLGALSAF